MQNFDRPKGSLTVQTKQKIFYLVFTSVLSCLLDCSHMVQILAILWGLLHWKSLCYASKRLRACLQRTYNALDWNQYSFVLKICSETTWSRAGKSLRLAHGPSHSFIFILVSLQTHSYTHSHLSHTISNPATGMFLGGQRKPKNVKQQRYLMHHCATGST